MTTLPQQLLRIIQQHHLLPPDETVVVAVSGGTDSLALLHLLHHLQKRLKITLHVATFDHGLRAEAAQEAQFVRELAQGWGLPVTTGKGDVKAQAKANKQGANNQGIEAAARQARYAFLAQVAGQVGAQRVVTAHQADDQAETVLMHILRGAGLPGLQGMSIISPMPLHPHLLLLRPLLSITRQQLQSYCQQHHLHPVEDPSNADTRFLRNYIRHEMLPYLKKTHPGVESALTHLAEIIQVEQHYLQAQYAQVAQPHITQGQGRVYIGRAAFQQMHPAMQRRCIYEAARSLAIELTIELADEMADKTAEALTLSYAPIIQAAAVGAGGAVGARAPLPAHLRLRVDYTALVIEPLDSPPSPAEDAYLQMPTGMEIRLFTPGEVAVPGQGWRLKISHDADANHKPAARLRIPPGAALHLRTRRAGDRISPLGLQGGSQKIKRLMINRKIPQYIRDSIPLLIVDGEVCAVLLRENWVIAQSVAVEGDEPGVINFFVYFS